MTRECGMAYCHYPAVWSLLNGQIIRCDLHRLQADTDRAKFPRQLQPLSWERYEPKAAR